MSSVKRYDSDHGFGGDMDHTDRGDWVLATDYEALSSRHARAIEALRGLYDVVMWDGRINDGTKVLSALAAARAVLEEEKT